MAGAAERKTAPPPGSRRKLELSGVQETLVIPLYARALDYRSRRPILNDAQADEIVRSLDFDFEKFRPHALGKVLAARNRQLDEWIRTFVHEHPGGTVLNLGCGLDTRIYRIDPPSSILWSDVDLPDVIALRRGLFAERPGYRMRAGSITEPTWLSELPADRPALAVADGVFEYVDGNDVRRFLDAFAARFPRGAAVFDLMNSSAQRVVNRSLQTRSSAVLRWAIDDLRRLDALLPRYRRSATVRLFASRYLPLRLRCLYALGYLHPGVRNSLRVVRYEF